MDATGLGFEGGLCIGVGFLDVMGIHADEVVLLEAEEIQSIAGCASKAANKLREFHELLEMEDMFFLDVGKTQPALYTQKETLIRVLKVASKSIYVHIACNLRPDGQLEARLLLCQLHTAADDLRGTRPPPFDVALLANIHKGEH